MLLTSVKLHFIRGVLEAVPGYEHLAVHILGALADVGGQGEEEPYHVEAQLVGGTENSLLIITVNAGAELLTVCEAHSHVIEGQETKYRMAE